MVAFYFDFTSIPDTKYLRLERALSLQILLFLIDLGINWKKSEALFSPARNQSAQETILGGYIQPFFILTVMKLSLHQKKIESLWQMCHFPEVIV